ncbi:MAG: hypothetical protein OXU62_06035 [Gammaproteobacteria bacterium]|nr:hypothetical protein [Gammaproteobacteria bacterium]
MQTARLGDNAFVESEERLLGVDVDSERESLQKQGAINGEKNSPSSDARRPDAVELDIIQRVSRTAAHTKESIRVHFVRFYERLLPVEGTEDVTALVNKIKEMPTKAEDVLDDELARFEDESAIKGPKWRQAKEEHGQFRGNNRLVRPANYASIKSMVGLFSLLIVTESFLNASLLWELTGVLLAVGQTALITAVNVLFGASAMGLCLRYKNLVSLRDRWPCLICAPVVAAVLVFNFGVAHYRDALVNAKEQAEQLLISPNWDDESAEFIDLGFVDYTKRAMDSVLDGLFGIDSILSALLIIVGLGFFGFATYKWYSMLDPYPGYRKRDLALKAAHEDYRRLVDATRARMKAGIESALARNEDERTKVTNMRKQYHELNKRADTLRNNHAEWCVVLERTQAALLEIYRDSNRQARSEPAPEYFDDTDPIDSALVESPDFEPPSLGDMDSVVEAVRLAGEKMNEIAAEKRKRFNALVDMHQSADTPT